MVSAEFAVEVLIKKQPRIVGKVLRDGKGRRAFYRKYPIGTAKLRLLDSLSLDYRVAMSLSKWSVSEIHFESDDTLYKIKTKTLLNGKLDNYGEHDQLYVPLSSWQICKRGYDVPWTNRVVTIK